MDSLHDPLSCKPAPVRSQDSSRVFGSLDSEAGSHMLQVWVPYRTSARRALPGHAPGLAALAQSHPEEEREWQNEP